MRSSKWLSVLQHHLNGLPVRALLVRLGVSRDRAVARAGRWERGSQRGL